MFKRKAKKRMGLLLLVCLLLGGNCGTVYAEEEMERAEEVLVQAPSALLMEE